MFSAVVFIQPVIISEIIFFQPEKSQEIKDVVNSIIDFVNNFYFLVDFS